MMSVLILISSEPLVEISHDHKGSMITIPIIINATVIVVSVYVLQTLWFIGNQSVNAFSHEVDY